MSLLITAGRLLLGATRPASPVCAGRNRNPRFTLAVASQIRTAKTLPELFNDETQNSSFEKLRPNYPSALYKTILQFLAEKGGKTAAGGGKYKLAVDVGCGLGKSTLPLAPHFESVLGVESNDTLVKAARASSEAFPHVSYRAGDASDLSFLADNSVDLITAGTALHWFDVDKFYRESQRCLRSGGVLAAYTLDTDKIRIDTRDGQRIGQITDLIVDTLTNHHSDARILRCLDGYAQVYTLMAPFFRETLRCGPFATHDTYDIESFCYVAGPLLTTNEEMKAGFEGEPERLSKVINMIVDAYRPHAPPSDAIYLSWEISLILGRK